MNSQGGSLYGILWHIKLFSACLLPSPRRTWILIRGFTVPGMACWWLLCWSQIELSTICSYKFFPAGTTQHHMLVDDNIWTRDRAFISNWNHESYNPSHHTHHTIICSLPCSVPCSSSAKRVDVTCRPIVGYIYFTSVALFLFFSFLFSEGKLSNGSMYVDGRRRRNIWKPHSLSCWSVGDFGHILQILSILPSLSANGGPQ